MSVTTKARPTTKAKTTPAERAAKVKALADRLASFADSLDEDQAETYEARFDHYSPRNALLIVMQDPTATVVHGYGDWRTHGRQVRKGATGIAILAPAGSKTVDANPLGVPIPAPADGTPTAGQTERRFFRLVYVFDIAQTDPIPADPAE